MYRSSDSALTVIIPRMAKILKSHILERVEERMKKLGLTERAVGMRASGKPDVVRNWRTKDVLPRLDTLIQVAAALDTTPEWLTFGAGEEGAMRVPKISMINAGSFQMCDAVSQLEDMDTIEVTNLKPGEWYALEVVGDSMDRISPPGSIVIVNRQDKNLVPNACYIIRDEEEGATYKRYRSNPDRFEPVSSNPEHEPLFPDGGNMPEIFGRVHRSILDL